MKPLLAALETADASPVVVWTHLAYLAISLALTVWVARTLHRHGRIFLVASFQGNEALALALKYGDKPVNLQAALEFLSTKVGLVLVVLGAMHFGNIFVFSRLRGRPARPGQTPPVLPPVLPATHAPPLAG